jgi:hypothetical protein
MQIQRTVACESEVVTQRSSAFMVRGHNEYQFNAFVVRYLESCSHLLTTLHSLDSESMA